MPGETGFATAPDPASHPFIGQFAGAIKVVVYAGDTDIHSGIGVLIVVRAGMRHQPGG